MSPDRDEDGAEERKLIKLSETFLYNNISTTLDSDTIIVLTDPEKREVELLGKINVMSLDYRSNILIDPTNIDRWVAFSLAARNVGSGAVFRIKNLQVGLLIAEKKMEHGFISKEKYDAIKEEILAFMQEAGEFDYKDPTSEKVVSVAAGSVNFDNMPHFVTKDELFDDALDCAL